MPHSLSRLLGYGALLAMPAGVATAQDGTTSLELHLDQASSPGLVARLHAPGLARTAPIDAAGRALFLFLQPGPIEVDAVLGCGPWRIELQDGERRVLACAPQVEADSPGRASALELKDAPRPADPWSALRDIPGIVLDRVNVGGSESEQQSLVVSRGDPGSGAIFVLDGVDVTDAAVPGSIALYPDVTALHSIVVRTTALDPRVRTPGVQVAFGPRPARERFSGSALVRLGGGGLQSANLPESLRGRPFLRPRTESVSEIGLQAGGPLASGRASLWGSVFRNALDQEAFTEHDERLRTTGASLRGQVRSGAGTSSLLVVRGEKVHEDRDTGLTTSHDARWRQSGPAWVLAATDARRFGRTQLLTRASWLDASFRLDPYGGGSPSAFEDYRGVLQRSYYSLATNRPRLALGAEAGTARVFLGRQHALTGGIEYGRSTVETEQSWPGNGTLGLERRNVFFQAFRLTGFALLYREAVARSRIEEGGLWMRDEVKLSAYTLDLGLRLELLRGQNLPSTVEPNPAFPDLLPRAEYDGSGTGIHWFDALPRIGLARSFADRFVARVGYAAYAAPLGTGDVTFDNPVGREFGSLTYYWKDANANTVVEPGELDLVRGRIGAAGLDPSAPEVTQTPHRIDPELRAPRTHELRAGLDHRRGGAVFSLNATWRRQQGTLWRPLRNLTLADYAATGSVTGRLFEDEYAVTYYAPASTSKIVEGNGRVLANREGYSQDALAIEAAASGRLPGGVDGRIWAAFTDWRERFFDRSRAVQDPTPTDSQPQQGKGALAVRAGGLGRGDLFVNARWTGGLSLRADLPYRFGIWALVHARSGFPIPYIQVANTGDPTGGSKSVLISSTLDQYRLPSLLLADLRIDRSFKVGRGTLVASVDVFNATNSGETLQVARDIELPSFNRPREIVRPRIVRLGLDYRF